MNTIKVQIKKISCYPELVGTIHDITRLIVKNGKISGFSITVQNEQFAYPTTIDFNANEGEILDGFIDLNID